MHFARPRRALVLCRTWEAVLPEDWQHVRAKARFEIAFGFESRCRGEAYEHAPR